MSLFPLPSILSPITYFGSKRRMCRSLWDMMPPATTEVASPFLGGGSFELWMAGCQGVRVHGGDVFPQLVCFWEHLLRDPHALAARCAAISADFTAKPSRDAWKARTIAQDAPAADIAAAFYLLSITSFSGQTLSTGSSPERMRRLAANAETFIAVVRDFRSPNLSAVQADWRTHLERHPTAVVFADPPYVDVVDNIYGVRGDIHAAFDHAGFARHMLQRKSPWLITYDAAARDLFPRCRIDTHPHRWAARYGFKEGNEVIIRNY